MIKSIIMLALTVLSMPGHAEVAQSEYILLAKDAQLVGDVRYESQPDYISWWRGIGSALSWKLTGISPGTYTVSLLYSLEGKPANRTFSMSTESDTKKIYSLLPTGGWNAFKNKQLGALSISGTDASFKITALAIPPAGYLMNLQKVILKKML